MRWRFRIAALLAGVCLASALPPRAVSALQGGCPADMVRVKNYCVDRYETSLVDHASGASLSPYYPPHPSLVRRIRAVWQVERRQLGDAAARRMPLPDLPLVQARGSFMPRAVSRAGAVPQGYLNYYTAKRACERSGKRLCSKDEWVAACRGQRDTPHPYGAHFVRSKCNVYRLMHPAQELHSNASIGHTDPRLNLVWENGTDPLLRPTGGSAQCKSSWNGDAIYDMVGNLDEWIDDEHGVFMGGFYGRVTTKGCDAEISGHSAVYYDYSTGARCCRDAAK